MFVRVFFGDKNETANDYYALFAAICAAYVIIRHKDNIKRLIEGKENKVRK